MDAYRFQQGINIDFTFEVLKACDKQSMSFKKKKKELSPKYLFFLMYILTLFITTQCIFPEDS